MGTRMTVKSLQQKLDDSLPSGHLGIRISLDCAKRALETLAWVLDMEQCELDKEYYLMFEKE